MRRYMLLALAAMLFPVTAQGQIWRTRDLVTGLVAGYEQGQCERDHVYRPGRYSRSCERFARRLAVGQIDRLERFARRGRYGYGGRSDRYHDGRRDRYGRRNAHERTQRVRVRERTERIGIGVEAGVEVLDLVLTHTRENRRLEMEEQAMRPDPPPVVIREVPTAPAPVQTPQGVTVYNRTGCDGVIRQGDGKQLFVLNGGDTLVSSVQGLSFRATSGGDGCNAILITPLEAGKAVLSCRE